MAFPIIQFGTSRFLQAHVDLFVSEALGEASDGTHRRGADDAEPGEPQAHRGLRRGQTLCRSDQGHGGRRRFRQ